MARVRLQADDVDRLNAAQRVLLSPLGHEDPAQWRLRANHAVRRLVGADHSVFSVPSGASLVLLTDDTDPSFPDRFLGYFAGVVSGEYRFRDPALQSAERVRRAVGPAAFHEFELASRAAMRRSVALQEIFRPAGMTSQIGISASLPMAEATQFFGFEGRDAESRSERGLELLRLLVPAFEAGVRMQCGWRGRGAAFSAALDRAGQAAALYSTLGVPLQQNGRLRELLAGEPERGRLREEMDALARVLAARWSVPNRGAAAQPIEPRAHVRGAAAEYRLLAGYLDPELIGAEGVLVTVERRWPALPLPAELTARFTLTAREAEAALLLAQGLTDAAIAQRLAISTHTARRYSERVLRKLGLHSRSAVAITLLRPTDERADPA